MHSAKVVIGAMLAAILVATVGVAAHGEGAPVDEPGLTRLAGADRYATAVAVSSRSVASASTVFVADGRNFPDALSAGPAASGKGAPVLLSGPNGLGSAARSELARLGPTSVVIVGGTTVVPRSVESQAESAGATSVTRLAGSDRFETSAKVSARFWGHSDVVYLATGRAYPDALSGGALAAKNDAPVLLSNTRTIPADVAGELQRLAPQRVVLLGGASVLTAAVAAEVNDVLPAAQVRRLAGADRYATSAAVAADGWSTSDRVVIATALNFPDALAGVPAAAINDAPLLLTRDVCLPSPVASEVSRLAPTVRIVLGGESVLYDSGATTRCSSNTGSRSFAAAVAALKVATEQNSGYDRDLFQHWIDADGDCQDTRDEVLVAESRVKVTGCNITSGRWYSYYDGRTWTAASDVDIDHLVPLAEAWGSGARGWDSDTRRRYANDLGDSRTLVAVTDNVNQSKGSKDPSQWLPQRDQCRYAAEWTAVKLRWKLTADTAEKSTLRQLANTCSSRTVTWTPATVHSGQPPTPTEPPPSGGLKHEEDLGIPPPPPDLDCGEIRYRNFIVRPGDPHRFDADGDGIGCES